MRKITLLIALFFFQIVLGQAPEWDWAKSMDTHFNSWRHCLTVDPNGNSIVVVDFIGTTVTFGDITVNNDNPSHFYPEIAIIKYDNQGNVLWAKSYGGPKADFPTAVTTDATGNVYLTGRFEEAITFGSFTLESAASGVFIAKLDTNGNPVYAKKIIEEPSYSGYHAIRTDSVGNVYLSGSHNGPSATFGTIAINYGAVGSITSRPYVAKMDSQGNYLWVKSGQSTDTQSSGIVAVSLDIDTQGNVYFGGYFAANSVNFGTITLTKTNTFNGSCNIYLIKYDSNGNEIWARNTGNNLERITRDTVWDVKTDSDNNVYVAGFFTDVLHFDAITLNTVTNGQQFIVKYDPNGNALWAKTAMAPSGGVNTINSIAVDENNNVYTGGWFQSETQIDFGNGVIVTNPNPQQEGALFIVKYTPDGEAVWGRKALPFNTNTLVSLYCKSENEIYVSSSYATPTISFGEHVLTKGEGTYNQFLARLYYDPLSTTDWNTNKIKVYPNPTKDQLHISEPEAFTNYALYNILGTKVMSGRIRPEIGSIDVSTLAKGIYLLQLSDNESKSETIKIIKE